MQIDDGTFYHVQLNGDEEIFTDEQAVAEYISENDDDIDLDDPDVKMVAVETDTDDSDGWTIKGVVWQNIVLQYNT